MFDKSCYFYYYYYLSTCKQSHGGVATFAMGNDQYKCTILSSFCAFYSHHLTFICQLKQSR